MQRLWKINYHNNFKPTTTFIENLTYPIVIIIQSHRITYCSSHEYLLLNILQYIQTTVTKHISTII